MTTEHIVTTNGVRSDVYDDADNTMGHVLFADYDGGYSPEKVRDELSDMDGICVLFESSENSYHFWNLTVRSAKATALIALKLHADPRHTQIGWRKGRWTIRTGEKTENDGSTYKDAPKLDSVWYNDTDRPQSLPHWNYVRAMHDVKGLPFDVNFVGDAYTVEKYMSLTDQGKKEVRDG